MKWKFSVKNVYRKHVTYASKIVIGRRLYGLVRLEISTRENSSLILRRHLKSVPVKFAAVAGAKPLRHADAFAREMGA